MHSSDFLVVGAGIAGAYAAYGLSAHGQVAVLEREDQPGYHTTGRSAAFFAETYGNRHVRALTSASRGFYDAPPTDFAERALATPRGAMFVAREDQIAHLKAKYADDRQVLAGVTLLDGPAARARVPVLREGYVARALWDPQCRDLDVAALHQAYLRGARRRGARVVTGAEVRAATRRGGRWTVDTPAGRFAAPVLVNAAGAWGDRLAALAGVAPIGLVPMRRTIIVFPAPDAPPSRDWPLVLDIDDEFYFKPESGRILASPADETPMAPCDVQAEELDVALAVDRIQRATTLAVPRILKRWAGLRTFAPDRTPVVGMDPQAAGFFWLVGQGGYGIQTAPAMAELAGALATGTALPGHLAAHGVDPAALSPARLRAAQQSSS